MCCHDLLGNAQAKPVWSTSNPLTLPAARVVAAFFSALSWLHLCSALSIFAAFVSPKLCGLLYLNAALPLTHALYLLIVRNWRSRWPRPFTASAKFIHEAATSLRPPRQRLCCLVFRRDLSSDALFAASTFINHSTEED